MMKPSGKAQTNKSGKRGVKGQDRVYDTDLFLLEETDETGKRVRAGKIRMTHEVNNIITKQAKELKTSKSALVRLILESYVKFYEESRAIGGPKFFEPEKMVEDWINERSDMVSWLNNIKAKNIIIQDESKSPEVKMLSMQNVVLANMINLIHKNII